MINYHIDNSLNNTFKIRIRFENVDTETVDARLDVP